MRNLIITVKTSSIMKIPNKRELQQIASNHSSDIEFEGFMKLYKDYAKKKILIFNER